MTKENSKPSQTGSGPQFFSRNGPAVTKAAQIISGVETRGQNTLPAVPSDAYAGESTNMPINAQPMSSPAPPPKK